MYILKKGDENHQITKDVTKIGRHTANDIVINNLRVSRFHSQIVLINGRIFLKDNNTINGTFIGDDRILPDREILLKPGDDISFGSKVGEFPICTISVEQLPDENPSNEENEVVSTTNDSDSDDNMNNSPENDEYRDISRSCEESLARLHGEKPSVTSQKNVQDLKIKFTSSTVNESVSRQTPSHHSKISPSKVKSEPNENIDVPLLNNCTPCPDNQQVSSFSNVCPKQLPADNIVGTTPNIDGIALAPHSPVGKDAVRKALHNMLEQFLAEKVSGSNILPFLLNISNENAASSDCSNSTNSARVTTENINREILANVPSQPQLLASNASEKMCVKNDLEELNVVSVNVPETSSLSVAKTGHVSIKVDLSEDVENDVVEVGDTPPIASPVMNEGRSVDTSNSNESVERQSLSETHDRSSKKSKDQTCRLVSAKNIINLCDSNENSNDVIMISDDESSSHRRRLRKNRKNIDPNPIIIEDTRDDEDQSNNLAPCSNKSVVTTITVPVESVPTKDKPKVVFSEQIVTARKEFPPNNMPKVTVPQPTVNVATEPLPCNMLVVPSQDTNDAEKLLTDTQHISSFIDLCDDMKPTLVKREVLTQNNYSNLEEIIALDSDDEDFPSSQLNTTQINDMPDFSNSFELMFDEHDDIKKEPQMTWFEQLSESDMVEGNYVSRVQSPVSELDCISMAVPDGVLETESDGIFEAEPHSIHDVETNEAYEKMEVEEPPFSPKPSANIYDFDEQDELNEQPRSHEKVVDVKRQYNLKECAVILTDAQPLPQRSRKARKEIETSKQQPSANFDGFLLGLNNIYKKPDLLKKKQATLPLLQMSKARKRKSHSPKMSVQEKKIIKQRRKEKLKEIVPKPNEAEAKEKVRSEVKPVVKITDKNRGSYLIDTMIEKAGMPKRDESHKSESSISKQQTHPKKEPHHSFIHKKKMSSSNDEKLAEQIFDKYCKDEEIEAGQSCKKSDFQLTSDAVAVDIEIKIDEAIKKETNVRAKDVGLTKRSKKVSFSSGGDSFVSKQNKDFRLLPHMKITKKSSLKKRTVTYGPADIYNSPKSKKKVRFHKEPNYRIIPWDAAERRNNGIFAPAYKLNENLIRECICEFETAMAKVCSWNVKWLEEQQKYSDPPPLYPESEQLMLNCSLMMKYKEQLKLIMFNNLWRAIFNSWNKPDNDFFPHTQYINEKTSLSTLTIDSVDTTKEDKKLWTITASRTVPANDSDNDLLNGQIVILNFHVTQVVDGVPRKTMVFGYVAGVTKMPANDSELVVQRMFLKVFAKPFYIVPGEAKLKVLNYLKTFLRPFQALAMVTRSPLTDLIIDPRKSFSFESVVDASGDWFHDKFLDPSQRRAVANSLNCILSSEPSLCLIDGASGTGKTQIIVSLMRELFLKNNRNRFPNDLKVLIVTAQDIIADDLSYRLDGLNKKDKCFNFLRYGNCRGIHANMKNCTLDKKIQDLLNEDEGRKLINLEEEKNNLKAKIHSIKLVLDSTSAKPEKINDAKIKLTNNEREWNDMESENSKVIEQLKSQVAKEISIEGADIIITSLFSCWSSNFEQDFVPTHYNKGDIHKFTVCIFDDANLINETAMLVPMMLMVRSLILIGDQRNQIAIHKSKSPFYRLLIDCARKAPSSVTVLNNQYRSPPVIMQWVNEFYNSKCKIRAIQGSKLKTKSFFMFDLPVSGIDDINYRYEIQAKYCTTLVEKLNQLEDSNIRFGIIVAHPLQKDIIKSSNGLFERGRKVIVETLEEFIGREQDVVILCLPYHCVQYASWLYVAVTRAKSSLFVCGDFALLEDHECVRSLVQFAKNRKLYSLQDPFESDIPNSIILSSS